MDQQDPHPTRRRGVWTSLAVAAASGATVATLTLPATLPTRIRWPRHRRVPPRRRLPNPLRAGPRAAAPPADPNARRHLRAPADPNAPPPPPADPNAPPPPPVGPQCTATAAPATPMHRRRRTGSRVGSTTPRAASATSCPPGWVVGDASKLNYGQALLTKATGPAQNGQPAPMANDTSILLGRLDLKLFAGAEPDNTKAAVRLASDMGEFFMPFPGTRLNQQTGTTQRRRHDRQRLVLRGEVHRHHQAQRPDLGRRRRQRERRTRRAVSATSAGSWSGWAPPRTRSTPTPLPRWPIRFARGARRPPPPAPAAGPERAARTTGGSERPAAADPGRAPVGVPVPVETPVPEMMPGG